MKNSVIKVIFLLATVMTLSAQLSAQEQSRRDSLDLARMFSNKTEQWKEAYKSGVTVTGRNLLILKKVGEEWLIVLHMTVV